MKKQKIVLVYRGRGLVDKKREYRIEKVFNMSEYNPGDPLSESEMTNLVYNEQVEVEIKDVK